MSLPVIPVANGILPRPDGGTIRGVFLDSYTVRVLHSVGQGGVFLLLPYVSAQNSIYPVGVVCRLEQVWLQQVFNPYMNVKATAVFAEVSGRGRARARGFEMVDLLIVAQNVDPLDLNRLMEMDYPVIEGAGWQPVEGFTEMKGESDLPVTIYGFDLESGERLEISGNVGGLVPAEQAHTVEHAIIRCLKEYGMCTPKNLAAAIRHETEELKHSLEFGFRLKKPEVFGLTSAGQCGNPLTNLAHFYLAKEFVERLKEGRPLADSLNDARLKALSKITEELGLTTEPGLRAYQGLKKGMLHDDTPLSPSSLKKVLKRFPRSPWT